MAILYDSWFRSWLVEGLVHRSTSAIVLFGDVMLYENSDDLRSLARTNGKREPTHEIYASVDKIGAKYLATCGFKSLNSRGRNAVISTAYERSDIRVVLSNDNWRNYIFTYCGDTRYIAIEYDTNGYLHKYLYMPGVSGYAWCHYGKVLCISGPG